MAKLVQVRLKAVTVKENGYWEDQENIIAFTLVYPREGAPAVCAARRVKLTSGERLDFAADVDVPHGSNRAGKFHRKRFLVRALVRERELDGDDVLTGGHLRCGNAR